MSKALLRWVMLGLAALVAGPAAGWLSGSLRAPDGGRDATALLSESPARGVAYLLGVVGIAGLLGVVTARLCSLKTGLFSAGLVLAWAAWAGGRVDGIVRRTQSGSCLWSLALEGAALGLVGMILGWIITRAAARHTEEPKRAGAGPVWLTGPPIGIVVGGLAAWAFARSDLAGQAIVAATMAGLCGTLVGRVVIHRAPVASFLAVGAVLAVVGPVSGVVMEGPHLVESVYAGSVFPLSRLMPLDWLAGSFLGVPLGAAWAASMLEKRGGPAG